MADNTPGCGPLEPTPVKEFRQYKANGAITKGEIVGFYGTTGYTVDQANATTISPIGVAFETVADGNWFQVQVGGLCEYVTNDGTDVVAYDFLVPSAAGVAIPYTAVEIAGDATVGFMVQVFGQSLQADTSTTCTKVMLFKKVV